MLIYLSLPLQGFRLESQKTKEQIQEIEARHNEQPHLRLLQKELAKDITTRVHSEEDYKAAIDASEILFKKGNEAIEALKGMTEAIFVDVFEGVPQAEVLKFELEAGISIIELLSDKTGFLKSNGEARRALKENSISVNKEKVDETKKVLSSDLIDGCYILLQRGKKNYFIIKAV